MGANQQLTGEVRDLVRSLAPRHCCLVCLDAATQTLIQAVQCYSHCGTGVQALDSRHSLSGCALGCRSRSKLWMPWSFGKDQKNFFCPNFGEPQPQKATKLPDSISNLNQNLTHKATTVV